MNNTPQLRFPGFTGEWSEKKLGEVTNNEDSKRRPISKMNRNEGSFPYYGANGIQDYVDEYLFDGEYLLVGEDGSVINKDQTPVINWAAGKFWVNNHAHVLSEKKDYCLKYISLILSTIKIPGLVTGIPPKLNQENLSNISIPIPSPSEQQKIADCLSALDDLISAQWEKVDALKTRKKGLMQQLFPLKGETTPRLRFPGFTGEWSEKIVKEVCDINTGKSNTQDQVEDGQYPFYIRSATPVKSNRYLYDCEAVITIGDGQIGKVFHYVNGKFDLHQRCYMMSKFRGVTARFFYHFFATNFYDRAMRMTAKATVDSVRLEMIADMPILLPSPAEQQKIADCLSALDDFIASESAELEALKDHKKGLMQQLFPQPAK